MTLHKKILITLSSAVVLGALVFVSTNTPRTAVADGTQNVNGWGWSSNIGWVSFNNLSSGDGTPYGVNIDPSGDFSGYAWSPSVGWISFDPADLAQDVSGCTAAPCTAKLNWSTGAVSGWARALTAISNGGGWDGWINLSGVTMNTVTKQFTGYAWGADVVGWMDMSRVTAGALLTPSATLSGSGCTIATNASTCSGTFTWDIQNATTPNLYNFTRDVEYTTNPSGTDIPYLITSGVNIVQARDGGTSLAPMTVTGTCTLGTSWDGSTCAVVVPACSNGSDDDADVVFDDPISNPINPDPGCTDANDTTESPDPSTTACNDNLDNDRDGLTDYDGNGDLSKKDPGCSNAVDNNEFNLKSITPV